MHPEELGFVECDLNHIQKIEEKETQTSNISITDNSKNSPKLPLPREIVTSDQGPVSVFEFRQVLQDSDSPKSITIIKEILTEEIVNHSKELLIENAVSNKYRYCKEVIKPYLKSYLQECPDSQEQLISKIIHSADQEYPDYQPCFEVYEGSKEIEEKTLNSDKSSVSKVDAATSYDSDMGNKECLPKVDTSSTVLENQKSHTKDEGSSIQDLEKDKSGKPKCKSKTSITNVKSKSENKTIEQLPSPPKEEKPIPKSDCPSPAVAHKEPKSLETESNKSTLSICDYFEVNDPTAYDKASHDVKDPPETKTLNMDVKMKEMVAAHSETLATIKTAMEDFISKVYKTTQDAVTVIKTESAKHLETFRQAKSNNTENVQPKPSCEGKTEKATTGFSFLNRIESKDKKDDSTDDQGTISPGEILERIVGKVDSTISMISDKVSFDNIPDMLKLGKFKDPSSPYDIPTPPKEISNIIIKEPAQNSNSVFVTIKNRIYSMFSESDDKPKDVTDSNSSNSPSPPKKEDSDEDLINRLIE